MEMSCTVILNMTHPDKDEVSRIYKRLELQINRIEFFPLNWTIVHPIDENSPLFKMSDQEIINHDGEMLIHVKGFDEMFSQQVHRRFSYTLNELKLGYRFKRAFHVNDDGEIVLDLEKLDDIEPEPSART